jgi:hypothetical protein
MATLRRVNRKSGSDKKRKDERIAIHSAETSESKIKSTGSTY